MKIIQLTAENVKRLKVVDISPNGGLNQITGKNGSGKTSVLDSIWWALGGEKQVQSVPVRKGADSARIRLDLGDLVVERKFSAEGTSRLTVRERSPEQATDTPDKRLPFAEGGKSPQKILDALIGRLAFDPLAFANKSPREQYDDLKSIVKLDVDIEALEKANAGDFANRTDVNREAKAKHAQAEGIIIPLTPMRRVDEAELLSRLQAAAEHNAAIEREKAARERLQRDANDKKVSGVRHREIAAANRARTLQRIADLQKQIESARSEGDAMAASADDEATAELAAAAEMEQKIDAMTAISAPIDISDLRAKLDQAKETNALVARKEQALARYEALRAEAKAADKLADEITERMAARERVKKDAIANAKMPVDGLSFAAGRVIYNGLPYDQASDAERLRVSVAIAMEGNPTLRVLRIRDGSLLDDDGIKMLADLAQERDYQIWLERVDSTGKVGIVMENGEVVSE